MPLPIHHVLGILADNVRLRGSVMPLGRRRLTRWADGLNLPMGGDTVLYTGHMYQLMPSIICLSAEMEKIKDSWIAKAMGLGRIVNRFINTSAFMGRPSKDDEAAFDKYLRSIALLLSAAGIKFGYLYHKELYAGALIYDQGVDGVFKAHAQRVYDRLRQHGVRHVITVDPHTTNLLREVYPKYVKGYDLKVTSYLQALQQAKPTACKKLGTSVAVHDSCVYARYEGIVDEPRELLRGAGVELREQDFAKRMTHCCGGPIEALFPGKAREIAHDRLAELKKSGANNIAAMCPICLVSLQHAAGTNGTTVRDISDYLLEAYCKGTGS